MPPAGDAMIEIATVDPFVGGLLDSPALLKESGEAVSTTSPPFPSVSERFQPQSQLPTAILAA